MARLMCIDFGSRRIGIALTDKLQIISYPYKTIDTKKINFIDEIKNIIARQEVERIIIGLPTDVQGEDSITCKKIREFAQMLKRKVDIPFTFHDESFSSRKAQQIFHQSGKKLKGHKKNIDKIAAAIILQDYLQEQN